MKKCRCCQQNLELKNFCKKNNKKDGINIYCRRCEGLRRKKYYKDNKIVERQKSKKYKDSLRGRNVTSNQMYGVSVSDLLEWQNHKCAICQKEDKKDKRHLHIDHCHKTGRVRMLLCHGCNTASGIADNIELLKAKIEYLEVYKSP